MSIAPVFPLREQAEGKYETLEVTDLTKVVDQNIKMILLTRKGERLTNPNFGVGLHNYLFEEYNTVQNGLSSQPPLRENIISQLARYAPEIRIDNLTINTSIDGRLLNIKIKYYVKQERLASEFDLTIGEIQSNTAI